MPLLNAKEALRLKLASMPRAALNRLCCSKRVYASGRLDDIIDGLLDSVNSSEVDSFIKQEYAELIRKRQELIPAEELKSELGRVKEFSWGVVQGALDNKIQNEYVRKYSRHQELIAAVEQKLHRDVTSYVTCTWYNHWTTVLIEEEISQHPRVVPVLKKIKGVDLFFDGQPFDLKITYLPKGHNLNQAKSNPKGLAIWLYENQGEQRFGADNRLFVVLCDSNNPDNSWMLKRDFALIHDRITQFFNSENVGMADETTFSFRNKTYTPLSKLLFILN